MKVNFKLNSTFGKQENMNEKIKINFVTVVVVVATCSGYDSNEAWTKLAECLIWIVSYL